jgi:23S rRNA (uracil1939-C5)-methyltransferase
MTAADRRPTVSLRLEKLVGGGRALAHHEGDTWLVAGGLPSETVAAVELERRAGVVEAVTTEVLDGGHPARTAGPCPHAERCGGCDWPHVEPEAGGRLKAQVAAEAARGFGELAERVRQAPVRISPLFYRLRARLHWDPERATLGFYAPRSWQVHPIPSCRIVSPRLLGALGALTDALAARRTDRVDLEWLEDLQGTTAVAALRPARNGPQVVSPAWLPTEREVAGAVGGFHALTMSGQIDRGWGATGVVMRLPVPLEVPIGAFFQGNRHLIRWLFRKVEQLVGPQPTATWDLHAGVGLLAAAALSASSRALQLVEPHRPAARAAQRNLPAARVAIGRTAEAYLSRARDLPTAALVMTDPPRSGMSAQLRHQLAGWHPDRILTLACDPATWARDTGYLRERGYRLDQVELIDLFPSTHHVEILATLEAD